ncbi:MAG: hypothetical protein M3M85_03530 [bacterium]|nr:hypothetical protein [bacterium]
MKYDYSDIFQVNPDGSVFSDFPIRIHGFRTTMPPGTLFHPGTPFDGIDIAAKVGRTVKANIHDVDVFVITKFY